MSILARNCIPGPLPSLWTGNLLEYYSKPYIDIHKQWIRKYGKIVGYYMGPQPYVLVADPELAKNIQIKDFNKFSDRQTYPLIRGLHPNPIQDSDLVRSRGQQWKRLRNLLTPAFSVHKLRKIAPIMEAVVDDTVAIVGQYSVDDREFDIYQVFQAFTFETISMCGYGYYTGAQLDPEGNQYLWAARQVFDVNINRLLIVLIMCFPSLDYILYPFRRFVEIYDQYLGLSPVGLHLELAQKMVTFKEIFDGPHSPDMLQIMLDSMKRSPKAKHKKPSNRQQNGHNSSDNTCLTKDEVIANAVLFYEAGYETTSTALAFVAHILVNRLDIQQQIREEVIQLYKTDGRLDINVLSGLEFMECVINETLRLYPPVIGFITRQCLEDYKYKHLLIPKDTCVMIAAHHMHRDPDYWPDAETFEPNRFASGRRSAISTGLWQGFGSGPRNCVGMRLALFEMKLVLAKLLLNYRLESGPNTELGTKSVECKIVTLSPKNGVFVKAVKI